VSCSHNDGTASNHSDCHGAFFLTAFIQQLLLSLFFISSWGIPRDLHSFPTRRSSDLRRRSRKSRACAASLGPEPRRRRRTARHRSEEHTSELQSREKLVCRLLREKKKVDWTKIFSLQCLVRISGRPHCSSPFGEWRYG